MAHTIVGECNVHGNVVALCPFCQIEELERAKAELKGLRMAHAVDRERIQKLETMLAHKSK